MEREISKPLGFHEDAHDFQCSCCDYGWPRSEAQLDHRNRLTSPPLCLTCAGHSELTGHENVYKMLHDHDQESRRRYEVACQERNKMLKHNGSVVKKLNSLRIDFDKSIDFLDAATVRHWPKGPGEGCCCGQEHCAPCRAGANAWVTEKIQKRRAFKRMAG